MYCLYLTTYPRTYVYKIDVDMDSGTILVSVVFYKKGRIYTDTPVSTISVD
jgi:hypothetical protein